MIGMRLRLSDNATGADNQQERLQHISDDIGHYLSGFADGEGSFNISVVRRKSDYRSGWKIVASFNISQREATIPKLFQQTLQCGTIRYRQDGVCYFEVRKMVDINETVRNFFARFPLRSERQASRLEFLLQAAELLVRGEHLNPQGLEAILTIREQMTSNRERKYKMIDVLQNPQRLYARTA
jgi:LAGLIDADG endonuclease